VRREGGLTSGNESDLSPDGTARRQPVEARLARRASRRMSAIQTLEQHVKDQTSKRSEMKKSIKAWTENFIHVNGKSPTPLDKEEIRPLYVAHVKATSSRDKALARLAEVNNEEGTSGNESSANTLRRKSRMSRKDSARADALRATTANVDPVVAAPSGQDAATAQKAVKDWMGGATEKRDSHLPMVNTVVSALILTENRNVDYDSIALPTDSEHDDRAGRISALGRQPIVFSTNCDKPVASDIKSDMESDAETVQRRGVLIRQHSRRLAEDSGITKNRYNSRRNAEQDSESEAVTKIRTESFEKGAHPERAQSAEMGDDGRESSRNKSRRAAEDSGVTMNRYNSRRNAEHNEESDAVVRARTPGTQQASGDAGPVAGYETTEDQNEERPRSSKSRYTKPNRSTKGPAIYPSTAEHPDASMPSSDGNTLISEKPSSRNRSRREVVGDTANVNFSEISVHDPSEAAADRPRSRTGRSRSGEEESSNGTEGNVADRTGCRSLSRNDEKFSELVDGDDHTPILGNSEAPLKQSHLVVGNSDSEAAQRPRSKSKSRREEKFNEVDVNKSENTVKGDVAGNSYSETAERPRSKSRRSRKEEKSCDADVGRSDNIVRKDVDDNSRSETAERPRSKSRRSRKEEKTSETDADKSENTAKRDVVGNSDSETAERPRSKSRRSRKEEKSGEADADKSENTVKRDVVGNSDSETAERPRSKSRRSRKEEKTSETDADKSDNIVRKDVVGNSDSETAERPRSKSRRSRKEEKSGEADADKSENTVKRDVVGNSDSETAERPRSKSRRSRKEEKSGEADAGKSANTVKSKAADSDSEVAERPRSNSRRSSENAEKRPGKVAEGSRFSDSRSNGYPDSDYSGGDENQGAVVVRREPSTSAVEIDTDHGPGSRSRKHKLDTVSEIADEKAIQFAADKNGPAEPLVDFSASLPSTATVPVSTFTFGSSIGQSRRSKLQSTARQDDATPGSGNITAEVVAVAPITSTPVLPSQIIAHTQTSKMSNAVEVKGNDSSSDDDVGDSSTATKPKQGRKTVIATVQEPSNTAEAIALRKQKILEKAAQKRAALEAKQGGFAAVASTTATSTPSAGSTAPAVQPAAWKAFALLQGKSVPAPVQAPAPTLPDNVAEALKTALPDDNVPRRTMRGPRATLNVRRPSVLERMAAAVSGRFTGIGADEKEEG
jgi:hypothetical protein